MIHAYDRLVFTAIPERRGPYVASFTGILIRIANYSNCELCMALTIPPSSPVRRAQLG
jgi:hypothetical protein